MTTVIKNGKVVSTTGVIEQDVLIDGEKIIALGQPGFFAGAEQGADKVIDAAGKYVIPGGIDVHTHMELPFGGTFASDTFETGSRAAAWAAKPSANAATSASCHGRIEGMPARAQPAWPRTENAGRWAGRTNCADVVGRTRSGSAPARRKISRASWYQVV